MECLEDCTVFQCNDCGVCTLHINEYYMVHNGLWEVATEDMYSDGMLCIGCLEARLGGKLTADDFTDAPINHGVFEQSARLQQRLSTSN